MFEEKTLAWLFPPLPRMCIVYLKCKIYFLGHAPYPRLTPLGGLVLLVSCSCIGESFAEAGGRGWETSRREMGMVAHASKMMCERGTPYIFLRGNGWFVEILLCISSLYAAPILCKCWYATQMASKCLFLIAKGLHVHRCDNVCSIKNAFGTSSMV